MIDSETALRKVSAKCFRRAKQWYRNYLSAQLTVLTFLLIALFIAFDPFVSASIGLVCVLAIETLRWRSDLWKADGELFKREWELCSGLGTVPDAAMLADWLADKSAEILSDLDDAEIRGSEFDSRAPIGPRRIVENVQESSWWSKHECRRVSQILLVSLIVLIGLGFGVLLASLAALRRSAPVGELAQAVGTARNIGGIVCAVFTIVFSINVVRLFTEFREFAAQADDVFRRCATLLQLRDISERDALLVLHKYQNARSAAPLIPTQIWQKHGDHLREQWKRFRPPI